MSKYLIPVVLSIMVVTVSCKEKKEIAVSKEVNCISSPSTVTSNSKSVTINQKEGIEFALQYYKARTEKWAEDKFDLFNKGEMQHYYSDDAVFLGFRTTQNIYVLSNDFTVKSTDIFQDMEVSQSDGSSIKTEVLRVEIANPIVSVFTDKERKEYHEKHNVFIFVINQNGELKIQGDGDIKWYDSDKGLQLANCYVFEKDVDQIK